MQRCRFATPYNRNTIHSFNDLGGSFRLAGKNVFSTQKVHFRKNLISIRGLCISSNIVSVEQPLVQILILLEEKKKKATLGRIQCNIINHVTISGLFAKKIKCILYNNNFCFNIQFIYGSNNQQLAWFWQQWGNDDCSSEGACGGRVVAVRW